MDNFMKQGDQPPHSEQAEKAVLGGALCDTEAMIKIKPMLDTEDFYLPAHQRIYAAMLDAYEDGNEIDLVSICTKLKDKGELSNIGGRSFLADLADSTPSASKAMPG
jgi:replicative DNA helicase